MDKTKIKEIPPYIEEERYDDLCMASSKLSTVLNLVKGDSEKIQIITNLINDVDVKIKEIDEKLKKRIALWDEYKEHYYKAEVEKKTSNGSEFKTVYIYPYLIVKENSCLFMVEIDPNDDYHAMNDHSRNIELEWCGRVILEEITKEEFLRQAKLHSETILECRLKKQTFYNEVIMD